MANSVAIAVNDATDAAALSAVATFQSVLDSLPLWTARYGCSVDEDFRVWLDVPDQDLSGLTFSLTIGDDASVATVAGVVENQGHSILFYVPAVSGPAAWANQGAGGQGPGTYVMDLTGAEGSYTRSLFQFSSFTLGQSIPPAIVPPVAPVPPWTPMR